MLCGISTTLYEVLEVKGEALEEYALWTILRCLVTYISNNSRDKFLWHRISAKEVVLLPSGRLTLCFGDESPLFTQLPTMNEQLKDIALTILWCAEYNLDKSVPLSISNGLQSLLLTICDQHEFCTIDHVLEICNHQLNAKPCNDQVVISKLCASILGSTDELGKDETEQSKKALSWENAPENFIEVSSSFSDTSSKSSQLGCFFGKPCTLTSSIARGRNSKVYTANESSNANSEQSRKSCNKEKVPSKRNRLSTSFLSIEPLKSLLRIEEKVPVVTITSESVAARSATLRISFVNHSKLTMVVENPSTTSILDVLQASFSSFLPNTDDNSALNHFALATWIDSDYHFFDNSKLLSKVLHEFPSTINETYSLRILYFPPDTNLISQLLLTSMYVQLRADIVDERISTSHDDALALAALALQCELGDYQPVFGCGYFVIEEFLSPHLVSQLGLSYIRSELPVLHRQLAGIGENEARLLFLRKAQHLDEYGMTFHKAYRLKTCKEENATWIGVGPRGITIFDVRGNLNRIKRHSFRWTELKKISYNNRKIVLAKLKPEVKFKFYEHEASRAKYVVTTIGKLHKFYSEHSSSSQFSPLALFDDITKLSSTLNSNLTTQTSRSSGNVEVRNPINNKPPPPWTYSNPRFARNKPVLRRHSNASSLSSTEVEGQAIDQAVRKDSKANATSHPRQHHRKSFEPQEAYQTNGNDTMDMAMREMKNILEQSSTATLSSTGNNSKQNNDYENFQPDTSSVLHDEVVGPTPLPRTKHRAKIIAQHCASSIASLEVNNGEEDVHAAARSFYKSSLGDDALIPPCAEDFNKACLKTVQSDLSKS